MNKKTVAKRPSFLVYLIAIFFAPLYFFMRGRIAAGIVTLILFVVSIPLYFLFVFPGLIVWFICMAWACYNVKNEMTRANIAEQAVAIKNELRE